MKFRKKPVVIEAYRYLGNGFEAMTWATLVGDWDHGFSIRHGLPNDNDHGLFIRTLEGDMHVSEGDWIIQGVNGEFYPCKHDIFEKTYEGE